MKVLTSYFGGAPMSIDTGNVVRGRGRIMERRTWYMV